MSHDRPWGPGLLILACVGLIYFLASRPSWKERRRQRLEAEGWEDLGNYTARKRVEGGWIVNGRDGLTFYLADSDGSQ